MEQNHRVSDLDMSRFLMDATDFNPKSNVNLAVALYAQLNHVFCHEKIAYPNPLYIVSGSVAELGNIRTPLPCLSDIDIMLRSNWDVVIPPGAELPKPECLRRMSSRVEVYEAEPTLFPCYLLLNHRGILTLDPENEDRYVLHEGCQSNGPVMLPRMTLTSPDYKVGGPAMKSFRGNLRFTYYGQTIEASIERDSVFSIFCPKWPSEADDFVTRERESGWPSRAAIESVVKAGCDVVQVSHPFFRSNAYHWRWSFSRAEIRLIDSWTPVQKIVYHLLRHIRKCIHPPATVGSLFKTYFLKTLMLWNCERRPVGFWDRARLMQIVAGLTADLVGYVRGRFLPNYFIPRCNLFQDEHEMSDPAGSRFRDLADVLSPFTCVEWTIDWFHRNYYLCVTGNNMSLNPEHPLIGNSHYREDSAAEPAELLTCISLFSNASAWYSIRLVPNMCKLSLHSINAVDRRLIDCFKANVLLYIVRESQNEAKLPWHWLVDLVPEVTVDPDVNTLKRADSPLEFCEHDSTETYFHKALYLARILERCERAGVSLEVKDLLIELIESCLVKSLEYDDDDAPRMHCAVYVVFAVLVCRKRRYRKAAELCRKVLYKNDHTQCSGKIPLELLPVLGFHENDPTYERMCSDLRTSRGSVDVATTVVAYALLLEILALNPDSYNLPSRTILQRKIGIIDDDVDKSEPCICRRDEECENRQGTKIRYDDNVFVTTIRKYQKRQSYPPKNCAVHVTTCCPRDFEISSKANVFDNNSRLSLQTERARISLSLSDCLLRMSVSYLTHYLTSLIDAAEERSPLLKAVTQQYMALYHLKIGDVISAHSISDTIVNNWNYEDIFQNENLKSFHVLCSPPFDLLLEGDLAVLIGACHYNININRPKEEIDPAMLIDSVALALYVKAECMLRMERPLVDFLDLIQDKIFKFRINYPDWNFVPIQEIFSVLLDKVQLAFGIKIDEVSPGVYDLLPIDAETERP